MTGIIHSINISNGGVPKLPIDQGEVTVSGLKGDRCATPGIHGGPTQALSLLGLGVIEKLAAEGHPIAPGTTGENITISGLDWPALEPGMRLRLGNEVLIGLTSYASPCKTIAGSFTEGNVSWLNQRFHPGQSRLYSEVLEGGVIAVGDTVRVEAAPTANNEAAPIAPDPGAIKLSYVNLYVTDLDLSVEFFKDKLGLTLEFADKNFGYASFNAGPVRMGLAQIDPADEQNAGLTGRQTGFGFAVDDLEASYRHLEAQGVKFPMKPARQPWGGFMALFEDPDGNVFYLDQIDENAHL